jgi:hypothetical protein
MSNDFVYDPVRCLTVFSDSEGDFIITDIFFAETSDDYFWRAITDD